MIGGRSYQEWADLGFELVVFVFKLPLVLVAMLFVWGLVAPAYGLICLAEWLAFGLISAMEWLLAKWRRA
jgi:hypothetical protein